MERLVVRQRGQILVIFVGALVALLLVGAVVVDLGFVFMTRRQEQNAADPGAVAAARYITPTPDKPSMWAAACAYAVLNGFNATRTDTNAICPTASAADGSLITVNYPPGPSAGEFAGKQGYVEVIVRRDHTSFLAGLIGMSVIPVSTGAVAANDTGAGGSSSLVALSDQQCGGAAAATVNGGGGTMGGIYIHPASGVTALGGFIQINSPCGQGDAKATNDSCTDSNNKGAFVAAGGTRVIAPSLYVQGACDMQGSTADFQVPPSPMPPGCTTSVCRVDEAASYVGDPLALVRPPSPGGVAPNQPAGCTGTPANPASCTLNSTLTLWPGTYYGGWNIKNAAKITLNPGIYIIAGGGIKQTAGGSLDSANGRVMIYSTDDTLISGYQTTCATASPSDVRCQQNIDLQGSGSISLKGLDATPCPPYSTTGCPYAGMLLWQDGYGSGAHRGRADIGVGGSTSTSLEGTIYTAGGDVSLLGSGSTTGCTADSTGDFNCATVQIISWTWQIGGAAVLDMPYDPSKFYKLNLKGLVR